VYVYEAASFVAVLAVDVAVAVAVAVADNDFMLMMMMLMILDTSLHCERERQSTSVRDSHQDAERACIIHTNTPCHSRSHYYVNNRCEAPFNSPIVMTLTVDFCCFQALPRRTNTNGVLVGDIPSSPIAILAARFDTEAKNSLLIARGNPLAPTFESIVRHPRTSTVDIFSSS
jgi:hypothetical protein